MVEELGIPIIDFHQEMLKLDDPLEMFPFRANNHYNSEGYRLVASQIERRLVKEESLQAFRDFTVVYGKFGDQYEVRMLELGRKAEGWVEVLNGIPSGTEYVTLNSYIIKADIEKSGASHDH